jgi:hypothetical protein
LPPLFSIDAGQAGFMAAKRIQKLSIEVELVRVEVDDADARLRLAYRLLLKSAGGVRKSLNIESSRQEDVEEQSSNE